MKFLHRHHKALSGILLALALGGCLPLFLFSQNTDIKVAAAALGIFLLFISVLTFFKGLPGSALALGYGSLIFCGTLLRIWLHFLFPQGSTALNNLPVFLIIVFTIWIPLPGRLAKWTARKVDPPPPETEDAPLYDEKDAPEEEEIPLYLFTYKEWLGHRRAMRAMQRRQMFEMLGLLGFSLRFLFMIAGTVAGGYLLLGYTAADFSGLLNGFLPVFLVRALGGAIVVCAWTVLLRGFFRAFTAGGICMVLGCLYYFGRPLLLQVQAASPSAYFWILLLLAAGLLYTLFLLAKLALRRRMSFFTLYEKEKALFGMDFSLDGVTPIIDRPLLYKINVRWKKPESQKGWMRQTDRVNRLNISMSAYARLLGLVYAGFVFHGMKPELILYLYGPDEKDLRPRLEKFLRFFGDEAELAPPLEDRAWEAYTQIIYPDDITTCRIRNQRLYEHLESEGFDFSASLPVEFLLQFKEKEQALACLPQAQEAGYEGAQYLEKAKLPEGLDPDRGYRHFVMLQLHSLLGAERMQRNCEQAIALAARFGGRLLNWRVVPEERGE